MPNFKYKARDMQGNIRQGERNAQSIDALSEELINENITPIEIIEVTKTLSFSDRFNTLFQNKAVMLEDLSIWARQMRLLHDAGVPIVTALKQIASFSRMARLSNALNGCVDYIQKGDRLSSAMKHFPMVFSTLMISIIAIGERTGNLSNSFEHIEKYLSFEATNIRQIKSAFRYPLFVISAIFFAIITLSIFVIPTFSRFYSNMEVSLPWQTKLLIGMSNVIVNYGVFLLIGIVLGTIYLFQSLKTAEGANLWGKYILRLPIIGRLVKRLNLIRVSESLSIILNSGIGVTQALVLVKDLIRNQYIRHQIESAEGLIQRGTLFSKALGEVELFTSLELQIITVGEKNGELGNALNYIGHFHANEIEFDLKRLNDWVGPILITAISILILIVAMGIYLPIWNMINLVHT